MAVGNRVRTEMIVKGISNRQMAALTGMGYDLLMRKLNERINFSPKELKQVASILERDVMYFIIRPEFHEKRKSLSNPALWEK